MTLKPYEYFFIYFLFRFIFTKFCFPLIKWLAYEIYFVIISIKIYNQMTAF